MIKIKIKEGLHRWCENDRVKTYKNPLLHKRHEKLFLKKWESTFQNSGINQWLATIWRVCIEEKLAKSQEEQRALWHFSLTLFPFHLCQLNDSLENNSLTIMWKSTAWQSLEKEEQDWRPFKLQFKTIFIIQPVW